MAKTYPVIERSGERITVLARSAEEAHAAATDELGVTCSIVSVEKVRSGGVGGFFATELVRLVASSARGPVADEPTARTATFASAEELLQALPQTAEFAARLKDEIALLTAKGLAAADTQIPTAAERAERAPTHTRRAAAAPPPQPAPAAATARAEPAPTNTGATGRREDVGDLPLPDLSDLRWAADDDAAEPDRIWRRPARGRRAAIETSSIDVVEEYPADPIPGTAADDALLWAVGELETEPPAPRLPYDVVPVPVPAADVPADDGRADDGGADDGRADDGGADDQGTDALLAQMLATELELDDRPVTARANHIRTGRAVWLAEDPGTEAADTRPGPHERPADPAESADREPNLEPVLEPAPEPEPVIAESMTESVSGPLPGSPGVHEAPIAPIAPVAPVAALPVPFAPPALPSGSWSAPTLRAFGVPDTLVERILQQRPTDDTEWTVAFMLAARHLCQPVPEGPTVLTGPSGANLARQLGLVSLTGDELGESTCSVASPNAGPLALKHGLGGRHVHLVVGGGWHHLVTVRPDVVSAASDFDLLEALRVAEAWGAVLGWALIEDRYVRIDPYLLAGRVRELLPSSTEVGSFGDSNGLPYP